MRTLTTRTAFALVVMSTLVAPDPVGAQNAESAAPTIKTARALVDTAAELTKVMEPSALVTSAPQETTAAVDDESEKRIGRKGAKQLSLGFSATGYKVERPTFDSRGRITGTKTSTQGFFFGQGDLGSFLSDSFLLRLGATFSGQIGGDLDPNVQGLVGFLYYFSPDGSGSLYAGVDTTKDLGTEGSKPYGYGRLGLQTMLNSRASFFVEGGYGKILSSESSGSGSFQVQAGLRFAFR